MSISQLARSIEESPTLALNEEARLLRAKGEPVIHLGIGEPKNKAPISASCHRCQTGGDIKYAPTDTFPLKKAIIRYTEENYGRLPAPEQDRPMGRSSHCTTSVPPSLTRRTVILPPYWVSCGDDRMAMAYGRGTRG